MHHAPGPIMAQFHLRGAVRAKSGASFPAKLFLYVYPVASGFEVLGVHGLSDQIPQRTRGTLFFFDFLR